MKEKYEKYILYGILGLVGIAFIIALFGFLEKSPELKNIELAAKTGDSASSLSPVISGSTASGDVSIELAPELNENQLKVKISANTHSVDLSQFDLKQITFLEYDGKSLSPVSAPALSGHHSNGEIIFNIDEELSSFIIRIKGIPKVEDRVFSWKALNPGGEK